MISTFLADHVWVAGAVLAAVVIAAPLLAWWLASRPRLTRILLVLSVAAVLVLTLLPSYRSIPAEGCYISTRLPYLTGPETLANVALFVPPALLASVALGRLRLVPLALIGGSLLSVAVELIQLLLPAIGRSCDSSDWITNTTGAAIGAVLAALGLVLARVRAARAGRPTTRPVPTAGPRARGGS